MSGETIISIVGNLTDAPNLSHTQNGIAVANFTIASTPRTFDKKTNEWKDGEALFMRCSLWREYAENASRSLQKGARVIAQGRLTQRSFETAQGEKRTVVELEVDEIGPALRYSTAQVTRTQGGSAGRSSSPQQASAEPWGQPAPVQSRPAADGVGDVWGAPGAVYNDEMPF